MSKQEIQQVKPEADKLAAIIASLTTTEQALLCGFAQGIALASTLDKKARKHGKAAHYGKRTKAKRTACANRADGAARA